MDYDNDHEPYDHNAAVLTCQLKAAKMALEQAESERDTAETALSAEVEISTSRASHIETAEKECAYWRAACLTARTELAHARDERDTARAELRTMKGITKAYHAAEAKLASLQARVKRTVAELETALQRVSVSQDYISFRGRVAAALEVLR